MSFRSRVLDALDIKKTTVKLQVNETFPKIYKDDVPLVGDVPNELQGVLDEQTVSNQVPYVVSKTIFDTPIGPNPIGGKAIMQSLDVLGFVVGKDIEEPNMDTYDSVTNPTPTTYKNMYPITCQQTIVASTDVASSASYGLSRVGHKGGHDKLYTGFHSLNGLYDSESKELQHMRKSALPVIDMQTMNQAGSTVLDHAHKDWPSSIMDQHHLLNENPYSDSLYYHSMKLSFLLTGIQIPDVSEKASNHRGMVRMLILRPRIPSVKMRWDGVSNQPHINMAHPPHWDTDLFYSGKRTMGGRMDSSVRTNTANVPSSSTGTGGQQITTPATFDADKAHFIPTFGLMNHANTYPDIDSNVKSLHYGHRIPGNGIEHNFTSYDVLTAPINRDKYAVVVDKMVALDTVHHGVASKRLENIVIPFNKKIKFPGRKAATTGELSTETIDEPLNMASRPIIMFLSMDQKISAQVTGYTTITEC